MAYHEERFIRFIKPQVTFDELILSASMKKMLNQFQKEYRYKRLFEKYGLKARRRLLLSGPPGCGKTSIAHALAAQSKQQLGYVDIEQIINSLLGQTSKNVANMFAQIGDRNCVVLLDEIDMLAMNRTYGLTGVGNEMSRATNSLLRALDAYEGNAMIVGATNLGESLDSAIIRRFDDVVQMDEPNKTSYKKLFDLRMDGYDVPDKVRDKMLQTMEKSKFSLSDADRLCSDVKKQVLMSFKPSALTADITTVVRVKHLTTALHGARARKAVLLRTAKA